MNLHRNQLAFVAVLGFCALCSSMTHPASADTYTYEGTLLVKGERAVAQTVDVRFRVWDAESGGTLLVPTQTVREVAVINGAFRAPVEIEGDLLKKTTCWLEIGVRDHAGGSKSPFVTLKPRQQVSGSRASEEDSFTDRNRDRHNQQLQFALNRWFNASGSLFMNIDADNDNADDQSFNVVKNTSTDVGGTTLLRVQEDGRVGIGTSAPSHTLTIESSDQQTLRLIGPLGGSIGYGARLVFGDYTPYIEEDLDDHLLYFAGRHAFMGGSLVGIGTTNPAWPLDVSATQAVGRWTSTASAFGSVLELRNSTTSPQFIGGINFVNASGQYNGQIAYTADDDMTFRAGGVERIRIDSSGGVGIGTASPGAQLHVDSNGVWASTINAVNSQTSGFTYGLFAHNESPDGKGVFSQAVSQTGVNYGVMSASHSVSGFDFYAAGVGIDYGTQSSRRWKTNIKNIDDPLERISKLRGVYFNWDVEHGGHRDVGFIAEEVGEVLPEIVRYEENGIDAVGMDYTKIAPLLVESLNALRAEMDHQIAERDARIVELEARLAHLEALMTEVLNNQRN